MMILFGGASAVVLPPTGIVKQPTRILLDNDGTAGASVISGQTSVTVDDGESSTSIDS